MCEIELTLRRGANLPRIEYGKDKLEEHKLEIQEILNVLNASSSPHDENFGVGERASRSAPFHPQFTTKASGSKSGTPSALVQLPRFVRSTESPGPFLLNLGTLACERLISRAFGLHELPSLIEEIFSSKDTGDTIGCLLGDDVQAFVDVMDEACSTFAHHYESVHRI